MIEFANLRQRLARRFVRQRWALIALAMMFVFMALAQPLDLFDFVCRHRRVCSDSAAGAGRRRGNAAKP